MDKFEDLWEKEQLEYTADGKTIWYPIVRVGRTVPFGYKKHPTDDHILIPIPEELDLLEKAKIYRKTYSYRKVAEWLSVESGRYISHVGLVKRLDLERKRRRHAANSRRTAKRYKEVALKTKKLESIIGGRRSVKGQGNIYRTDSSGICTGPQEPNELDDIIEGTGGSKSTTD